jgi:hypothetical protein
MRNRVGVSFVFAFSLAVACSSDPSTSSARHGTTKPSSPDQGNGDTPGDGTPGTPDGGAQGTDAAPPAKPAGAIAQDVKVTQIAVLQGVKIDVVKDGVKVASRNAPVVAGRDALVRVYVTPDAGYKTRSLTCELTLADGANKKVLADTKTEAAASSDDDMGSTFDFEVTGDLLTTTTEIAVAVRDPAEDPGSSSAQGGAQYPSSGAPEALGAESSGDQLKVTVVPIQYAADGSNRVPDTGAAQLEAYRSKMFDLYPARKVEITVRKPWAYPSQISASGQGFSNVLQSLQQLREQDNAPDDVYYYGAFMAAPTFAQYCGGGCVTGLSTLASSPSDAFARASVGIGFTGDESTITMAHELGHAHGRQHSPCGGASGPDPAYPYPGGGIGVQGYDLLAKQLVDVAQGKDIMGYCQPEWISDYTYHALFDRMQFVNNAKGMAFAFPTPQPYRFVNVAPDGALTWGSPVTLRARPWGEEHAVEFQRPDGTVVARATGHYYAYDHLPGGYVLVPEGPAVATHVAIAGLGGRSVSRLAR